MKIQLSTDDVDTDLLRLLAAKAMTVNKVDKSKKHWSKQNGVSVSASTDARWVETGVVKKFVNVDWILSGI